MGKSKREQPIYYTEDGLRGFLGEDTEKGKIHKLYAEPYVKCNERFVRGNKEIKLHEFIANYLYNCRNLFDSDFFDGITEKRQEYIQESHEKLAKQREPLFAKSLFKAEFSGLGKIIDYQTPIGSKKRNIDLLAYNEKKKQLSFIELKREYNEEPMLRAILEIYTYFQLIDKEALKKELIKKGICSEIKGEIQKVVLVFEGSTQHKQYMEKSGITRKLAEKLGVKVFTMEMKITDITTA